VDHPAITRLLIVGGTGFIGRHVAGLAAARGQVVTAASRAAIDLSQDDGADWRDKVANFDCVINCAGIVRSRGASTMEKIHAEGPIRLFRACRDAGVPRLIHISALGVTTDGETEYQRTKAQAETFLKSLDSEGARIDWCIVRPSVVIGRGGASTKMMVALASLPVMPRFGSDDWRFQPIHIGDLAEMVVRLAESDDAPPRQIDAVGPQPMNSCETLVALREWLGLSKGLFFPLPEA
jgi:uncharacterized protein YbjT (DUF2867 family)